MAFDRRKMRFYTEAQLEAIRNPKPRPPMSKLDVAVMLGFVAGTLMQPRVPRHGPKFPDHVF